tara:strand:+ start:270 stop:740 length:471 start_codon:yes stop_codon:yes gene_type:complete
MTLPYLTALRADQLRSAGIPAPWTFGYADMVRYGEIDMLHHVNNGVYLKWFENLRVRYFIERGIWTADGTQPKVVVRNAGLHFRAEVKLGQNYILTARTTKIGTTSFTMDYGVWVDGTLTTTGDAVLVAIDDKGQKCALSDSAKQVFRQFDGAVQA